MARLPCNKKLWWLTLPALIIVGIVVALVLVLGNDSEDDTTAPEVTIAQGRLVGVNLVTRNSRNIFGFKGIPFAEPPVGELRFKGPQPPNAWNGTFDATEDSNLCPQTSIFGNVASGDEDCLYLNVYTPTLPTSENFTSLPVMVFIHGGAFKIGDNNEEACGPQFLLDKDVVLVVPSYRLGILGFLSTGDEVAPGNWGLKDQVRALEWTQENIEYFGGDPNQVTIFGQSAGSISVHLLTLSNSTDGLFHRYMTNSGTALSYDAQRPGQGLASRTLQVGEYLGCPTNTSTDLVDCLRSFDAAELVATHSLFIEWETYPNVVWSPSVEPDVEGAFLTERPADLVKAGKIRDLPWVSSVTRNEGILYASDFYLNPELLEDFLSNVDIALPPMLTYDVEVENVTAYTEALKSYYLNDLTADRDLLLSNYTQLIGDAMFVYPTYSANEGQLAYAQSPQYFCSFEYRGTFSWSYLFSNGDATNHGVSHTDDLIYLFPSPYTQLAPPGFEMSEADWRMVDTMVQLWTSFAITGTPTLDADDTVTWERYSSQKNYLRIGNDSDTSLENAYNFFQDRASFWDELTAATTWL